MDGDLCRGGGFRLRRSGRGDLLNFRRAYHHLWLCSLWCFIRAISGRFFDGLTSRCLRGAGYLAVGGLLLGFSRCSLKFAMNHPPGIPADGGVSGPGNIGAGHKRSFEYIPCHGTGTGSVSVLIPPTGPSRYLTCFRSVIPNQSSAVSRSLISTFAQRRGRNREQEADKEPARFHG